MAKEITVDLVQLEALAGRGYSVTMICEAMGISRSYAYSNKDIKDTIKRGHSQARQSVVNDLMSRSKEDVSATASIYLSKQLKVFDDYYPTSKPKSISQALSKITGIYDAVAKNELDVVKGDKLIHYLEIYIRGFESSELEQRLNKLEVMLNEQK